MCRMLLAIGKIQLSPLLSALKQMAQDQTTLHERNEKNGLGTWIHDDGWGLAYLNQGTFSLIKSIKPIFNDQKVEQTVTIKTNLALFHVRAASIGSVCLKNTHPFYFKTDIGEEVVFCHNGTIKEKIFFDQKYKPKGTTDSEQLLSAILTHYEKTKDFSQAIYKTFNQFTVQLNSNIILSTKTRSYIFSNNTLFPRYLQLWIGRTKDSLIVCSEKIAVMNKYSWEKLPTKKIIQIDHQTLQIKAIPR